MPENTGITYTTTADIPLTDLDRFPGNAKRGDIEAIRASIRRHGQYRSLVVRDTDNGRYTILAGNHTHDAIRAEGHPTARCEVIQCSDDEARRINLADNRLSDLGAYDHDALTELLSYLDDDYDGTGYTASDVEQLITPPDIPETADELANTEDTYREQYGVIIVCPTEADQQATYERLTDEGYACRVVTT